MHVDLWEQVKGEGSIFNFSRFSGLTTLVGSDSLCESSTSHHINITMKKHPSQRSPLERALRDQAVEALKEFRSLPISLAFARGIQWGIYLGYKNAAVRCDFLSNDISQPAGQRPDYGRPVFLQQTAPEQSIEEMEAEGRVHIGTKRPNPHE